MLVLADGEGLIHQIRGEVLRRLRGPPLGLALIGHLAPVLPAGPQQAQVQGQLRRARERGQGPLELWPPSVLEWSGSIRHIGQQPHLDQPMRVPEVNRGKGPAIGIFLSLGPRSLRQAAPIDENGQIIDAQLAIPSEVLQKRSEVAEVIAIGVRMVAAEPTVGDGQHLGRLPAVVPDARHQLLGGPHGLGRQVLVPRQDVALSVDLLQPAASDEHYILRGESGPQRVPLLVVDVFLSVHLPDLRNR
mmetsp:Transcript_86804/g.221143  ORF Transcript_86804/g.221143 Transcript_86804/m.221143 type:complete len:246 (-) Transcript_86804:69-806(-)